MMQRRTFIGIVGGGLLGCVRIAAAQEAGKVWRVGFLAGGVRPADGTIPQPLREQLASLGYVEGKNITYEGRWGEGRVERLPDLAVELLARKQDAVMAFGGPAAAAAKRASGTIPIVAFNAGDVVDTGLIASLARPGGNITGVNDPAASLSSKRIEILTELVPGAKRVAVLWNAGNYSMTLRYREIEKAAEVLRIAIEPLGVREPGDFDAALAAMTRLRPDAVMMLTDALTNLNMQRVLDYVSAAKIPAIYEFDYVVRAGGLVSYGSDQGEIFKLAAKYVARVLSGAKPADLPVEQPNGYFLVINLKSAKAMGLAVPQALLRRADELIQ